MQERLERLEPKLAAGERRLGRLQIAFTLPWRRQSLALCAVAFMALLVVGRSEAAEAPKDQPGLLQAALVASVEAMGDIRVVGKHDRELLVSPTLRSDGQLLLEFSWTRKTVQASSTSQRNKWFCQTLYSPDLRRVVTITKRRHRVSTAVDALGRMALLQAIKAVLVQFEEDRPIQIDVDRVGDRSVFFVEVSQYTSKGIQSIPVTLLVDFRILPIPRFGER